MDKTLNYTAVFNKYFQKIKMLRNPKAEMPELEDLNWNVVVKQDIYDFGGKDLKRYVDIVEAARKISISCLHEITYHLQGVKLLFDSLDCSSLTEEDKKVCFVLRHKESGDLLIFKEIEDCSFWKLKGKEPHNIAQFMKDNGASSCKYIYLMFDYAYLQLIGYSEDEADPGRGYNLYSIKWFFETYYGPDEYALFRDALDKYNESINEYLGFILVRSLTPNATVNFKKIFERKIITFPYDKLLSQKAKTYYLSADSYSSIRKQYLQRKNYLVALGNNDFSESLITAEWLYESMREAKAIDLTAIAMGYFKAVEQLLYHLICLHAGENRKIQKDYSFKELPLLINLDEDSIAMKSINTSIGSMANFYKDNLNMLRNDLDYPTKKYIRESIFEYKDLRNGYSHKDNIHDWFVIDYIREATYQLFFLVMGSQQLSDSDLTKLGMPDSEDSSDYSKLCEYIDFHAGNIFLIDIGHESDEITIGCRDMRSTMDADGHVNYSGVYLKEIGKQGRTFKFEEDCLPKTIWLGKFLFAHTEHIDITPVKVKKVFENGKYVGPSIVEDDSFDY